MGGPVVLIPSDNFSGIPLIPLNWISRMGGYMTPIHSTCVGWYGLARGRLTVNIYAFFRGERGLTGEVGTLVDGGMGES